MDPSKQPRHVHKVVIHSMATEKTLQIRSVILGLAKSKWPLMSTCRGVSRPFPMMVSINQAGWVAHYSITSPNNRLVDLKIEHKKFQGLASRVYVQHTEVDVVHLHGSGPPVPGLRSTYSVVADLRFPFGGL